MTANTSATGGPLTAAGSLIFVGADDIIFEGVGPIEWRGAGPPPPQDDDALDDFFQALVVGVTGLAGDLVRPRFQAEPPAIPAQGVNWAAVGVVNRQRDTYASVDHDPIGEGWDSVTRYEDLELLCSFYGPRCQTLGSLFDDGLMVPQNREALYLADMELTSTGDLVKAPELIKGRWLPRADLPILIRRKVTRYYPVRSLVSASAVITAPPLSQTVTVAP